MTVEVKLLTLVQRLHDKTKAGEILWEKTPRADLFQTAFQNFVVKLWNRPSEQHPDALDYVVSIVDEAGTVIERASDVDLQRFAPSGENIFKVMEELYTIARRQALGVEGALDALLGELGR